MRRFTLLFFAALSLSACKREASEPASPTPDRELTTRAPEADAEVERALSAAAQACERAASSCAQQPPAELAATFIRAASERGWGALGALVVGASSSDPSLSLLSARALETWLDAASFAEWTRASGKPPWTIARRLDELLTKSPPEHAARLAPAITFVAAARKEDGPLSRRVLSSELDERVRAALIEIGPSVSESALESALSILIKPKASDAIRRAAVRGVLSSPLWEKEGDARGLCEQGAQHAFGAADNASFGEASTTWAARCVGLVDTDVYVEILYRALDQQSFPIALVRAIGEACHRTKITVGAQEPCRELVEHLAEYAQIKSVPPAVRGEAALAVVAAQPGPQSLELLEHTLGRGVPPKLEARMIEELHSVSPR